MYALADSRRAALLIVPIVVCGVLGAFPRTEAVLSVSVPEAAHLPVRLLFVGDAMFDRTVRREGQAQGYDALIGAFGPLFEAHDLVVLNLEGPVTSYPSVSLHSRIGEPANTRFTFSEAVVPVLAKYGVIAHLGNNHIWDFGPEGIEQTKAALNRHGVRFFGDSGGQTAAQLLWDAGDVRIGLVSYNAFSEGSALRAEQALRGLRRKSDVLVLYAHWGQEYETVPESSQRVLARRFIDAGADLVVGSHPHVVQTVESYGGSPIYFSLGNFVFDQYWMPAVRCGAALSVTIQSKAIVTHETFPVRLERTRHSIPESCNES